MQRANGTMSTLVKCECCFKRASSVELTSPIAL